MVLSSKMQGLNYGAPLLGLAKSILSLRNFLSIVEHCGVSFFFFSFFLISAFKPKFAASEKIKELSKDLVMVNVEVCYQTAHLQHSNFQTQLNTYKNANMLPQSYRSTLERFSNDCQETNTKVITPTNHIRSKQRDELIRIPSNYLSSLKVREKSRVQILVLHLIG